MEMLVRWSGETDFIDVYGCVDYSFIRVVET